MLNQWKVDFKSIEVDTIKDDNQFYYAVKSKLDKRTLPQIYINGKFIGGYDGLVDSQEKGSLFKIIDSHSFDYDLIVIGGGSGGLAASKVTIES